MSIIPRTVPSKKLAQALLSTDLSIVLNNIVDWDGTNLETADFGTQLFVTLTNDTKTKLEIIELDPATIADGAITILNRGLGFDGGYVPIPALALDWAANETTVQLGADIPQLFNNFVDFGQDQEIGGLKTFTTFPRVPTGNPTDAREVPSKGYVDAAATGSATYDQQIISQVAGETLLAGEWVYFKESDQKWWKTNASLPATSVGVDIGVVKANAVANDPVQVLISGLEKAQTGMTPGDDYYLSDTAGEIDNTAGTEEVIVGNAETATQILLSTKVGKSEVSTGGGANTIPRLDGSSKYPAGDGSQLTNLGVQSEISVVAGQDIGKDDAVFVENEGQSVGEKIFANQTAAIGYYFGLSGSSYNYALGKRMSLYSGTMSQIEIAVQKVNSPTDGVIVEIQSDSGTFPSGTVLATGTITAGEIGSGMNIIKVDLDTVVEMVSGTDYWIVVRRSGTLDNSNYFIWAAGNATNQDPNGKNANKRESASWATAGVNQDYDFYSVIYFVTETNKMYKASAADKSLARYVGIADAVYAEGVAATAIINGEFTTDLTLTNGRNYYLSNTPGEISLLVGIFPIVVGTSTSTAILFIKSIQKQTLFELTASDVLQASADTERWQTGPTTYIKKKEISVDSLGGILRVKADMRGSHAGGGLNTYIRVYVNGVAVGAEHFQSSSTWTTYTDDIPVEPGDLVQLYYKTNNGSISVYTRNFRIHFDVTQVLETQDTSGTTVNLD